MRTIGIILFVILVGGIVTGIALAPQTTKPPLKDTAIGEAVQRVNEFIKASWNFIVRILKTAYSATNRAVATAVGWIFEKIIGPIFHWLFQSFNRVIVGNNPYIQVEKVGGGP